MSTISSCASTQMLPFAARQQFLEHGYAILPSVLSPSMVERLRSSTLSSTIARKRTFANWPPLDTLLKSQSMRLSDPFYDGMMSYVEKKAFLKRYHKQVLKRRRTYRRIAKEFLRGRSRADLSGEELWELSELIAKTKIKSSGEGCTSTVFTDAQMLRAIDEYRSNAWMTNTELRELLKEDDFRQPLSILSEIVGGVERPVVFGDAPLLRESFGNPVGYHCTAPQIGVRTNERRRTPAVTLLILTYTPTSLRLPIYILKGSHRPVAEQYMHSVNPSKLFSPFQPCETHIPVQLKHFQFDSSISGELLAPVPSGNMTDFGAAEGPVLQPGTVVVVDPHLMMAFGTNSTNTAEVVYRLNVVAEDARPVLSIPSWIRGWRTMPYEVSFKAPIVFPPLHCDKGRTGP